MTHLLTQLLTAYLKNRLIARPTPKNTYNNCITRMVTKYCHVDVQCMEVLLTAVHRASLVQELINNSLEKVENKKDTKKILKSNLKTNCMF